MTAGELALVLGALLCATTFAAFIVTLVRVRDAAVELRRQTGSTRAARRLRSET